MNNLIKSKQFLILVILIVIIITPMLKPQMAEIQNIIYEIVRDKTPDRFVSAIERSDEFSVKKIYRNVDYPVAIKARVTVDYQKHSNNSLSSIVESFEAHVLPELSEIEFDRDAQLDFFDESNYSDESDASVLFGFFIHFSDRNKINIEVEIYDDDINAEDFEPIAENVRRIYRQAKNGIEYAELSEEFLNKYPHLRKP